MIIWKGWGILLIVIGVAALLLTEVVIEALLGNPAYFQDHTWPMAAAVLIAAGAVWVLGNRLNGGTGRTLVDQETGEQVVLRGDHSFFFIKLQYWAPILAVLAVLLLFA